MSKSLQDMTREELYEEIQRLKTLETSTGTKKFGLIWEEKYDVKVDELQTSAPTLIENESKRVTTSPVDVNHILINGDNYQAMTALKETHTGKVDVIYIDPPYNTGNRDFIYNDKIVDRKDAYQHSHWLSFMHHRLALALELLSEHGVILVAIDDNEQARLKLLMDEIFGEKNFIANIVWQGTPSSLAKFTSGGVDYMLAYAKNIKKAHGWKRKKPYAEEMVELVAQKMKTSTVEETTIALRNFIKKNKANMDAGLTSYNRVDARGRIYANADLSNTLYRPNLKYPITDPSTGDVYQPSDNGWKLGQETMQKLIDDELVLFEGRKYPRKKLLLTDYMYALPPQSFKSERSKGSTVVKNILGKNAFNFPKSVTVIKEWISSVNNDPHAVILDFFAGSGTTAHAVLELNKEDGGDRQCILVTDGGKAELVGESAKNLKGKAVHIAEEITYERVKRVITGENWSDGKKHEPLGGNLKYYNTVLCPK